MFRALRNRNFRLYYGGQGISLVGTWMQRMASDWLVYQLTHSTLWLGLNAFLSQVPNFLFAPFAGVYVDRLSRYRLLFWTQALAGVQAMVLWYLVWRGTVSILAVALANFVLGLVNAVDVPARQSFVVEMLDDRADLPNAIALNSSLVTLTKMIGPAVAGFLIAGLGEGPCFLLNGLSYVAVLTALAAMHIKQEKRARPKGNVVAGIMEGFRYAFGYGPIRAVIILLAISGLAGVPYVTLLPVYAADVLGGGANTLGLLTSATGVGALFGAVYLARRSSVLRLGTMIARMALVFGLSLMAFSFSPWLSLSLPLLGGVGLGMMVQLASTNTFLQTVVDDEKRGRVMSLYTVAFIGTAPFGSLISGIAAHAIGARTTVLLSGILVVGGAVWFSRQLRPLDDQVRTVYLKKGLIEEPPAGVDPSLPHVAVF